jgi:tRNA1(Val) A37 N6-methylase TrmN6
VSAITKDALFEGALTLVQPARGYRVNVDSILLAAFAASTGRAKRIVDLGAGVGAVTLAFAHFSRFGEAHLIERDPELVRLLKQNFRRAKLEVAIATLDLEAGLPRALVGSADLVLANPPFFEPGERRPAQAARETGRAGRLEPFLRAARAALAGTRGRAAFVYPARSLARFLSIAERLGLVAKRLRLVHPRLDRPARIALIELKPAKPGGLVIDPPLVEWRKRGEPTPELAALTRGVLLEANRAIGRT